MRQNVYNSQPHFLIKSKIRPCNACKLEISNINTIELKGIAYKGLRKCTNKI